MAEPHELLPDMGLDTLYAQRDVLTLEEKLLRRWDNGVPDAKMVTFGGGAASEFTLIGQAQERYAAAAIYNYSTAAVNIGFSAGAGVFAYFTANAGKLLVIPQNYTDLSLSVSAAVAAGPVLTPITVQRLWVAPLAPSVSSLT